MFMSLTYKFEGTSHHIYGAPDRPKDRKRFI